MCLFRRSQPHVTVCSRKCRSPCILYIDIYIYIMWTGITIITLSKIAIGLKKKLNQSMNWQKSMYCNYLSYCFPQIVSSAVVCSHWRLFTSIITALAGVGDRYRYQGCAGQAQHLRRRGFWGSKSFTLVFLCRLRLCSRRKVRTAGAGTRLT